MPVLTFKVTPEEARQIRAKARADRAESVSAYLRKRALGGFVEGAPAPRLASWADSPAKTSDAYLAQVPAFRRLHLATFEGGIRGAARIS